MAIDSWEERARRIDQRLQELAGITDEPGVLTRTFLSAAMKGANTCVRQWMQEAGLETQEDYAGNLIGRQRSNAGNAGLSDAAFLPPSGTTADRLAKSENAERRLVRHSLSDVGRPNAKRQLKDGRSPVLLIGSHLDTVRNAGRYDGPLGVVLGIEVIDWTRHAGRQFPFELAVTAFSDEEGVRFKTGFLGSSAFCGLLSGDDLKAADADGILLGSLLTERVVEPSQLRRPTFPLERLIGYFEIHLEQGPVLEHRNRALGAVTAIAGQARLRCTWTGKAAHAGTTPIDLRKDALVGAAAFVQEVDQVAREWPGLVATVGELRVEPNVSNVVPASVIHSLDVRHQDNENRIAAVNKLKERAAAIAAKRYLSLEWKSLQDTNSTLCDARLNTALRAAIHKVTGEVVDLPSGAGHDGATLSRVCPVAMLFVRCRDGLSHHPDEFVDLPDVAAALRATAEFLDELSVRLVHSK
jgi:allantoate deiminase